MKNNLFVAAGLTVALTLPWSAPGQTAGPQQPIGMQGVEDQHENAQDFMQIHQIEITFHKAGTDKNLDLMLSLFADDATLSAGGKTYRGKDEIRGYWQAAGPFQPQNHWVAYTPAFRINYTVSGDMGHLYFECLYVDKVSKQIAAHTNSDDTLVRTGGKWLIKSMKAATVPEL